MAETCKVLGQVLPSSGSFFDLYVVPASTSAVVSTITICNTHTSAVTIRLRVKESGAATDDKQFLYYDLELEAKDTFAATFGITLAAGDEIEVYASTANKVAFNAFGTEITA